MSTYEDPFAGRERLNQLSPEELKFRNDRMSHQPLTGVAMTDTERNEISRNYYVSLTTARAEAIAKDATQRDPAPRVDQTATTPTQPTTAQTQGGYELPYGWNERLNTTAPINDLKCIPPAQPQSIESKSKDEVLAELNIVMTAIDELRKDIERVVKSLGGESDMAKKQQILHELKTKRALLEQAQERESNLMLQL
jgi:hypothetical protein